MTKAKQLLRRWCSHGQWEQYKQSEEKYIDVIGGHTGHRYRLYRYSYNRNVYSCLILFINRKNILCSLGIYPDDWQYMPWEDYLLSIKLALETNEEEVLRKACLFERCLPSEKEKVFFGMDLRSLEY